MRPPRAGLLVAAAAPGVLLCLTIGMGGCRRSERSVVDRKAGPLLAGAAVPVEIHRVGVVSPEKAAEYAGDAACVKCHREEADAHAGSHHALTLRAVGAVDAERFRRRSGIRDAELGVVFETRLEKGRCLLTARRGSRSAAAEAEYAFGSGNRGVTYIGRYGERLVELRISYYAHLGRWGFSPNQPRARASGMPVGRPVDEAEARECFRCHSTFLVERDGRLDPERSGLGIGCESCHGPGRAHVEAVRRDEPDLRMARLASDPERVSLELCGQCHGPSGSSDLTEPAVQSQLARFQAIALAESACFLGSQGRLGCATCHDPHRNMDRGNLAPYDRACRSCHEGHPDRRECPRAGAGSCVSCHMPLQRLAFPTRPAYRNHWIAVWGRDGVPAGSGASITMPGGRPRPEPGPSLPASPRGAPRPRAG